MADDMSVEEEQHPEALDEPRANGAVVRVDGDAPGLVLHDTENHPVVDGQVGMLEGHEVPLHLQGEKVHPEAPDGAVARVDGDVPSRVEQVLRLDADAGPVAERATVATCPCIDILDNDMIDT
jgi:hypothetical protein